MDTFHRMNVMIDFIVLATVCQATMNAKNEHLS